MSMPRQLRLCWAELITRSYVVNIADNKRRRISILLKKPGKKQLLLNWNNNYLVVEMIAHARTLSVLGGHGRRDRPEWSRGLNAIRLRRRRTASVREVPRVRHRCRHDNRVCTPCHGAFDQSVVGNAVRWNFVGDRYGDDDDTILLVNWTGRVRSRLQRYAVEYGVYVYACERERKKERERWKEGIRQDAVFASERTRSEGMTPDTSEKRTTRYSS